MIAPIYLSFTALSHYLVSVLSFALIFTIVTIPIPGYRPIYPIQ